MKEKEKTEWRPPQSRRWSRAEAKEVVAVHKAHGGSVAAFCRRYGIGEKRMYNWIRELREEAGYKEPEKVAMGFQPVHIVSERTPEAELGDKTAEVVVEHKNGFRVHIPARLEQKTLRRCFAALAEISS